MFTLRADQMVAFAAFSEGQSEERALSHLRNCIPEVCAALSESELRDIPG